MELTIRSLKGLQFIGKGHITHVEITSGFGLYVEGKGYLCFTKTTPKDGIRTPYNNRKKVLQSIIDQGGLVHYDDITWLTPIN